MKRKKKRPDGRWVGNKYVLYEDTLHKQCVKWMRAQYPKVLCYHVPNGGSRNLLEAKKLKRMGVVAGIPDIVIDYPRQSYHGARIELKTGDGTASDKQESMIDYYNRHGYYAQTAYTLDEFMHYVNYYMGL